MTFFILGCDIFSDDNIHPVCRYWHGLLDIFIIRIYPFENTVIITTTKGLPNQAYMTLVYFHYHFKTLCFSYSQTH